MNEELAVGLKIAKKKPCNYALIWKDAKTRTLIVSKKKIKPKAVKDARKALKANKVLQGTCYGEGGVNMVFEKLPDEPLPPKGDMLLKLLIAEETGIKYKPEFRDVAELTDVPEEDEQGEDAASPPSAATAGSDTGSGASPEAEPVATFSIVKAQKSRLAWDSARKQVKSDLGALGKAIVAEFQDDPRKPDLRGAVTKLNSILEELDEELLDKLDEALNAEGRERERLHGEAKQIIKRYIRFVDSNELVKDLDNNPFVPLKTHALLKKTLSTLDAQL